MSVSPIAPSLGKQGSPYSHEIAAATGSLIV